MTKRLSPIYHKVINEVDENGVLKYQVTISADKWNNSQFANYRKDTPIREGIRTQIKILKIDGVNTRETYINFDTLNENIKIALSDMYLVVEDYVLKGGL